MYTLQKMVEPAMHAMSFAVYFVIFAVLVCLAILIYLQKAESPRSKRGKLNLMLFVILLSSSMMAETVYRFYAEIGAEAYEAWAIKFYHFLSFLSVIFLVNAISISVGEPRPKDFSEWFKEGPLKPGVPLFVGIFALTMAFATLLPSAMSGKKPSIWYNSVYFVFVGVVTIILVSYLWKTVKVSGSKRGASTIWGGTLALFGFQFSHLFIEHLGEAFEMVYYPVFLVGISIASVMTFIGFKEKTALEHFVLESKHPPSSDVFKNELVFKIGEGESVIVTYTSATDKMKVFSAFIQEGLKSGDIVWYTYPDEERETVRAKLEEYGIDVKKHEKDGSLRLQSLTEHFMPNGKLDYEKAVIHGLNVWAEAKKKGYKHLRDISDLSDFSFVNGQWQRYVTDYWLDPRWNDPTVSEWVEVNEPVGVVYDPFLMEITAINVGHMTETEVNELLRAFGKGIVVPAKFADLLENADLFSGSIGLDHERLVGRKILLEFDPVSDYEKVVDRLAKESMANVEPIYVFTAIKSPLHTYLAKQPAIKFFLTSLSTSIPKSTSENTMLLPAKNTPLILDAISKVLENHVGANVCIVFDVLSELLTTVGRERTLTFLRQALDLLSSEKATSIFLLNTNAHETEVVSQLRTLFSNQLTYNKNGLEVVKAP